MTTTMHAKIASVCAAHTEWQRGAIAEREYLRRADILDAEHAAIERCLSRYADSQTVRRRVMDVLAGLEDAR